MKNRTPSDVIADGRKIKAAVAHLLNDEHLAVFDAVLAIAEARVLLNRATSPSPTMAEQIKHDEAWSDAYDREHTALLAAGVEVEQ